MPTIFEFADDAIGRLTDIQSKATQLPGLGRQISVADGKIDVLHQGIVDLRDEVAQLRNEVAGLESLSSQLLALTGAVPTGRPIVGFKADVYQVKAFGGSGFRGTYAEGYEQSRDVAFAFVTQDLRSSQALFLARATGARAAIQGSVINNLDELAPEVRAELEKPRWGEAAPPAVHWLESIDLLGPPERDDEVVIRAESYANRIAVYASSRRSGPATGLTIDKFALKTLDKPDATDFVLASVREIGEGCYTLTMRPSPAATVKWDRGAYMLALTVAVWPSGNPTVIVTI